MRRLLVPGLCAMLSAGLGCRFDSGGLGGDDVLAIDARAIDADPTAPDAAPPDAAFTPPDAAPPDAFVPLPDTDLDGVIDALDNCLAIGNPEQFDEDLDGDGDVCDNCPHVFNPTQAGGGDGDAVGDACDPSPGASGDTILFFDGFNGATRSAGWVIGAGTDTWAVSGGSIRQIDTARELKLLYLDTVTLTRGTVEVALTPSSIPPSSAMGDNSRNIGVITAYVPGTGVGAGRYTLIADQINDADASYIVVGGQATTGATNSDASNFLPGALSLQRYRISVDLTSTQQDGIAFDTLGGSATATHALAATAGKVGLRSRAIAAGYEYVVVFGAP